MRTAAGLLSVVAVLGLVAACGGSAPSEIFDPVDASTVAPDGAIVAPDGGAVSPPDAAVSPPDAAVSPPDAAVSPPDAAVPPANSPSRLSCGVFTCAIPGGTCCVTRGGGGGGFTYACSAGACPTSGGGAPPTPLKCRGAANCGPGTVCCINESNGGVTSSSCKPSCGAKEAQLCDPAVPSAAAGCAGERCSTDNIGEWRLPTSYATCGGKGT